MFEFDTVMTLRITVKWIVILWYEPFASNFRLDSELNYMTYLGTVIISRHVFGRLKSTRHLD